MTSRQQAIPVPVPQCRSRSFPAGRNTNLEIPEPARRCIIALYYVSPAHRFPFLRRTPSTLNNPSINAITVSTEY